MLFRTSTGRDATSSDIAVYDAFVRSVLADTGHADIKPYAGFFKVFGSTMDARNTGAGGTTARVHNGMNTIHVGHLTDPEADGGIWEDGSTRTRVGNSAIGVPTYWLNGAILANNYADMCDLGWSSGDGVTTGWDTDDPRSEDGTRNIPSGAISDYAPYETWTGTGNACEAYNHPFGFTTVSRSSADSGGGQRLLHSVSATNTGIHPFYGYSPVFKVVAALPSLKVEVPTVTEGETGVITLTLSEPASQAIGITVSATTVPNCGSGFTCPPGTTPAGGNDHSLTTASITFAIGETTKTVSFTATDDSVSESTEVFLISVGNLSATEATIDPSTPPDGTSVGNPFWFVQIQDNDNPGNPNITIAPGASPVTEGTDATFTVTAAPAPTAATTVSVAVTEDTSGGQDFVASGNEITHTVSIPASGSQGAGSATLTIPTVGDNTQESDGVVTATVNTGSGYTVGNPSTATVVVNDDDGATPGVTVTMSCLRRRLRRQRRRGRGRYHRLPHDYVNAGTAR